jgi:4-hydroxybenzoate polyprenyltransferase
MFLIDWKGFLILSFYFIMNIAYTFGLKKISIVDITIIAIGFVLRILIGGFVFNVALSNWIIIMTFLLAIFLAAAKRRDDVLVLTEKKIKTRKAIDGYNLMLIDGILLIVAAVILVSYIMYAISPATLKQYETNYLYITVIFVFLGLFRYLQITFVEKRSGSPTKVLYRDRFTQINLILWLFTYFVIIYW